MKPHCPIVLQRTGPLLTLAIVLSFGCVFDWPSRAASPTSTARPSARFRLLALDSSRSQVEECSPTSQDATRAHRFRSAFRLSLWGLSEFQLWIRTRVLLRRTLNRSLSQLTWPSSISEAQAGELAYRKSTSVLPRTRNRKLVSVSVVAHQRIAAAEIQGQPAQATD